MPKIRTLSWWLIAWTLPAVIAAALGWRGVWGGGSAFTDYLIPIPVAGGALHVPSFLVATVAVMLLPTLGAAGAVRVRALLIGMALAGVLYLLNLQPILAALKTGAAWPSLWEANPLGLFLLSDALLALLFTAAVPRPWLRVDLAALVLVLLPVALPLSMALPRVGALAEVKFTAGPGQHGDARGDEMLMVHTTFDPAAPDFRRHAEAWALQPQSMVHPRFHVSAETMALLFTRDAEAGRRSGRDKAEATLCLYEDDTPPRWLPGAGDCFSGHENFSGQVARAAAARPAEEPAELRSHLAAVELCAPFRDRPVPEGQGLQLTRGLICAGLPRERERLRRKFPDDPRLAS
ncbi:MAG: hypothetical protein KIT13_10195 [Burkholderiales bacterium]|nr:hypothetical protein [Burkholderiales bacterium]